MDLTFTTSNRRQGFTLIELMITLAIGAILAMLATPAFNHLILSNRLTTTANALSDAVTGARLDAVKLNAHVQFCGSAAGSGDALDSACGGQAGAVYEQAQGASVASLVRAAPPAGSGIQASGVANLRFSGQGIGWRDGGTVGAPYNGVIATVCAPGLSEDNQRVLNMSAGSVISITTASGSCP